MNTNHFENNVSGAKRTKGLKKRMPGRYIYHTLHGPTIMILRHCQFSVPACPGRT